ncbi:MAG: hypothetical protein SFW36_04330 [Leptolyngbyaceae cyanobacterium bins.59]|nr:hypothetical protein [Leptolyngbyaceae cyanobacterium bins.59]
MMDINEQVGRQRVKYIISRYHLNDAEGDSSDPEIFESQLEKLLRTYPTPLIELALVETLVASWLNYPFVRGVEFLNQAQIHLQTWEQESVVSTITPEQFSQIAGLDPTPIFGVPHLTPAK